MVFFRASVLKNLKRIAAAPWSLAIWIGVPQLVGGLLSAIVGGSSGVTTKVHLLTADNDRSFLSGVLIDVLTSDRFADMLIIEPTSAEAGSLHTADVCLLQEQPSPDFTVYWSLA